HTYFVMLAYSLLVRELDKTSLSEWASVKLTTIGESCRAMLKESLRNMINWLIDRLDFTGKTAKRMQALLARLGLAK
ncbi:MAG: IS701 family transposase, partial [Planctomycetaceae bacterium]|nr:IS701 family transposase [Planctomycetaceae bacterium]